MKHKDACLAYVDEVVRLRQTNAALLEALERMLELDSIANREHAREAIALVKGETR